MFLGANTTEVAEGSEHGLVRCQGIFALATQHFAHTARQNAVLIGNGGYDAWDKIILQIEDRVGSERALIRLRPQMGCRNCVRELYRQAQLTARLPQATFHHIARTEFFADGADIPGFARCSDLRINPALIVSLHDIFVTGYAPSNLVSEDLAPSAASRSLLACIGLAASSGEKPISSPACSFSRLNIGTLPVNRAPLRRSCCCRSYLRLRLRSTRPRKVKRSSSFRSSLSDNSTVSTVWSWYLEGTERCPLAMITPSLGRDAKPTRLSAKD